MAAKYTNVNGISIPMAVWLARDEYNHDDRSNVLSVTSLLKSVRQIVLSRRAAIDHNMVKIEDISNRLASRLGTSLHNSIEEAWVDNHQQALLDLGYPSRAVNKVLVNPEPSEIKSDSIVMYLEKRTEKQVGNWIISGQFDIIFDGQVQDIKSTSVHTYISGNKDKDYCMQGSLYRWLNPKEITDDHMAVQFIFKDWSKNQSLSNPAYPKLPVLEHKIELKSIPETDMFVHNKLQEIERYMESPEPEIPFCTDEELWRKPSEFKYYGKEGAKRASKRFDNLADAKSYLYEKGKGFIKEIKSEPTACRYCPCINLCSQGQSYIATGELK